MNGDGSSIGWLHRLVSTTLLLLVGSSWPLWTTGGEFPQIPWLAGTAAIPEFIQTLLLGGLGATTVVSLVRPAAPGFARHVAGAQWLSWGGLLLFDQHRCQPWAYEFLLLLGILWLSPRYRGLECCRAIVISVYFWSGVSKVDPGFVEGHGQMLLDGLCLSLGTSIQWWSDGQREVAAALMPMGELAIAGLLACQWSRRIGVVISLAMHGTLLFALGPRGLNHEAGVLLWNGYFGVQNLILFWRQDKIDLVEDTATIALSDRGAKVLTFAAVLAPLLNIWGYWDHWPSWSVYSAHPGIVRMFVRETDIPRLPASLQPLVGPPAPLEEWRPVQLDQWSFRKRSVPPYPQERWKLAIAAAVMSQAGITEDARIDLLTRDGRWTTTRTTQSFRSRRQLEEFLTQAYWINAAARPAAESGFPASLNHSPPRPERRLVSK